jgi:hypothetical protein
VGDQPVTGWFERYGGQCAVEIWFVNRNGADAGCQGVRIQPVKCQFIGRREHHYDVGRPMPTADDAGMSDREIKRGVCRLASLRSGRQIAAGYEVEARSTALAVWHGAKSIGRDRPAAPNFPPTDSA